MSEIKGTIKNILEVESGTSKAGKEWSKLTFVVSNNDGYEGAEQIFAFDIFGAEKVEDFLKYNKVGKDVEVSFNIRTKEYNGKYYTTLQSWKIFSSSKGDQYTESIEDEKVSGIVEDETDDLPF